MSENVESVALEFKKQKEKKNKSTILTGLYTFSVQVPRPTQESREHVAPGERVFLQMAKTENDHNIPKSPKEHRHTHAHTHAHTPRHLSVYSVSARRSFLELPRLPHPVCLRVAL